MFGKQSKEFVKNIDANLDIASVCLSYLSFDCFDDALSTEDIARNILSGDYVLLTYAATEWLDHIQQCARHLESDLLGGLRDIVLKFSENRENYFFQPETENCYAATNNFEPFQNWPDVNEFLIKMDAFIRKRRGFVLEQNGRYLRGAMNCTRMETLLTSYM